PLRLAQKLVQIHAALGLSQNDMVKRLGLDDRVARSNLSVYELGLREPSVLILLKYAETAGVCLDVLVNDELDLPKRLPGTPRHRGIAGTLRSNLS
ncbi:MAG: helix-turn-helix domain-containing protein, partial [Blastocatellia bacterium]